MLVLFHRIAYIEAAPGMYFREKTGLVEGNPVYHLSGSVVNKLKLDMLHLAAHEFARAEIHNVTGAEHRLLIAGSERVETPESGDKLGCKLRECQEGVDVELRLQL